MAACRGYNLQYVAHPHVHPAVALARKVAEIHTDVEIARIFPGARVLDYCGNAERADPAVHVRRPPLAPVDAWPMLKARQAARANYCECVDVCPHGPFDVARCTDVAYYLDPSEFVDLVWTLRHGVFYVIVNRYRDFGGKQYEASYSSRLVQRTYHNGDTVVTRLVTVTVPGNNAGYVHHDPSWLDAPSYTHDDRSIAISQCAQIGPMHIYRLVRFTGAIPDRVAPATIAERVTEARETVRPLAAAASTELATINPEACYFLLNVPKLTMDDAGTPYFTTQATIVPIVPEVIQTAANLTLARPRDMKHVRAVADTVARLLGAMRWPADVVAAATPLHIAWAVLLHLQREIAVYTALKSHARTLATHKDLLNPENWREDLAWYERLADAIRALYAWRPLAWVKRFYRRLVGPTPAAPLTLAGVDQPDAATRLLDIGRVLAQRFPPARVLAACRALAERAIRAASATQPPGRVMAGADRVAKLAYHLGYEPADVVAVVDAIINPAGVVLRSMQRIGQRCKWAPLHTPVTYVTRFITSTLGPEQAGRVAGAWAAFRTADFGHLGWLLYLYAAVANPYSILLLVPAWANPTLVVAYAEDFAQRTSIVAATSVGVPPVLARMCVGLGCGITEALWKWSAGYRVSAVASIVMHPLFCLLPWRWSGLLHAGINVAITAALSETGTPTAATC